MNFDGALQRFISDIASAKNCDGAYRDIVGWHHSRNIKGKLTRHVAKHFEAVGRGFWLKFIYAILINVVVVVFAKMGTTWTF